MTRPVLIVLLGVWLPFAASAQCVMPSGPPAEAGVILFNDDHKVMQYCNGDKWVGLWGGSGGGGAARLSGEVVAFDLAACPDGWSEYLPARGRFIRGIDNGAGNDPAGTRAAGHIQEDALQNITGRFRYRTTRGEVSGAFYEIPGNQERGSVTDHGPSPVITGFDASRVVRTANETRPKNVALLYCRKD